MAYLLKYDSVHGQFKYDIKAEGTDLIINGRKIRVHACLDPSDIPWGQTSSEYICETSGAFTMASKAVSHLSNGATKVIISAPTKDDTPMFVMGVNNDVCF